MGARLADIEAAPGLFIRYQPLGLSAFTGVIFIAAHHATAINIGIIAGILPVFVLAGGLLVYQTPTRWVQWWGAGVMLAGVAVVASAADIERLLQLRLNDADMLMVAAVVLYARYTLG